MPANEENHISRLQEAYRKRNLTLYLGAGVSVANGLPTWPQLVLSMYFRLIDERKAGKHHRPFSNYLFAIAEWHLDHRDEPLEITARKVRKLCEAEGGDLITKLRSVLYEGFKEEPEKEIQNPNCDPLLAANPTLAAVIRLCDARNRNRAASVITYNYDNLLEYAGNWELPRVNGDGMFQPIWKFGETVGEGRIPVYHVHGYVPMEGDASSAEEIVFTEEQYHDAYQNLYSWSNLVQIQAMTNSVGLMIGLSMTDPNMRRLLDAVRRLPSKPEHYVLLRRPDRQVLTDSDAHKIDEKARKYADRFMRSGIKSPGSKFSQIVEILSDLQQEDEGQQVGILKDLGVHIVWWSDPQEIPAAIDAIMRPEDPQAPV